MDAESGSRALAAVNDLIELLRLAQGAADRLEHEVHGPAYEHYEILAGELDRLRRAAEGLKASTERLVRREQSANDARGHPLRRAADRITTLGHRAAN
jgi:hypothetical protein